MKRLCLLFCLFCLPFACPAQETAASGEPGAQSRRADSPSSIAADLDSARFAGIDRKLETLVERDSTFARTVDVTAGRLPLTELLRNIARASGVNLSVRSVENIPVSCNFTRTRVDDLVRFLCREYRLDVETTGNIVSVFPAAAAPRPQPDPEIFYNAADTTLFYDLNGERLIDVTKKITTFSGRNIIVPQPLYDCKVSGYVRAMPFDGALQTLAAVNGLVAEKDASEVWMVYREPAEQQESGRTGPSYVRRRQFSENELHVDSLGRITAHIARGQVQDIILDLCGQLGLNYYFQSPVSLTTGVWIDDTDFETLLAVLLKGSQFSYYCERGIYVFGAAQGDGLASATVVPLAYRAVAKVEEVVPAALKQGVEIKTFPDLNSLILSGDRRDVARVETFLRSVDKPVPLITMEIIIADVQRSNIREMGIGGGVGTSPVQTSGTLGPGLDMTYSAGAVNNLLRRIQGTVNLGRVSPNFYLSLQALEENGTVRLQSTPKLSTLNGHEATLTSGETQYYKEVQNNYYGTQNPISSESYQWKSVDANLSVKVTPYVSTDRQITLEIEFEQTEFTGREQENAPPGTATRSFKSIVKVRNEEMVLLGGLDRNSMEKSSRGIPFLARVPIIKWFFGKEKRNKVERTLNVFIKPTVIE
ncbi:type II secretion system protein GspD [Alistipes finegoldii]|uniref:type II secretion system protein GspD n=1 Tax=Alistipes finegoldii TaxID=214856 RepID=UPI00242FFDFA|nr:secretin N-terminal domain-containing protein [Alistipes finegoldii]